MRITSAYAFESSLSNLQRRQSQLSETQQQLTSGKRVLRASDDPSAAATAERARAATARTDAQLRALGASRHAMELTEGALGDAGEMLQQARELLIGAGNGSYNDADRSTLAASLESLRGDLLAVANRKDGTGRYLFGGQGSDSMPLRDAPGGVVYDGSAGQLNAAAGESTPLAVDGRAVWLQIPDPANPGVNLSVFDMLDTAVAELRTTGRTPAQIAQTVATGIGRVDASMNNLSSWRGRVGESLNRADGIENRLGRLRLDSERERVGAEDLDMVEAISDFQNKQSGYDAALKSYSMVQRMTLFDYLK